MNKWLILLACLAISIPGRATPLSAEYLEVIYKGCMQGCTEGNESGQAVCDRVCRCWGEGLKTSVTLEEIVDDIERKDAGRPADPAFESKVDTALGNCRHLVE